jgi:hypothetical protein
MLPNMPGPGSDPNKTKIIQAESAPVNESSLVRLEWFQSPFEAQAAKLLLEENAIRVNICPEGLGKPDGPAFLEVLATQEKKARRLLQRKKKK